MTTFIVVVLLIASLIQMGWLIKKSGWSQLQKEYKTALTAKELNAKKLAIFWCDLGGTGFKNLLILYDSPEGLLIRLRSRVFVLKLEVKPEELGILVPWEDFVEVSDVTKKVLFLGKEKHKRLLIGKPSVSYVELLEKDYSKIVERLPHLIDGND